MDFQQSKTYQNLRKAYERELMVSTLYDIFADKARQDGFIEIGFNFDTITRNEKEHARTFLRNLNSGTLPTTEQNLINSANYETETGSLYRDYATVAKDEGYTDLAALFNGVANIELNHNLLLSSEHDNVVREEVFCKPGETLWICLQCGNIMSGTCAPAICPVCGFPQGYYKVYPGVEET